jgi:hypothetical protein
LDISFICWFRLITILFCVFGVFKAEIDRTGMQGQQITQWLIEVQTLLDVFLNMPLRSSCFTGKALFLVKGIEDYFSQVLDYQECWIIRCQITGMLLYL